MSPVSRKKELELSVIMPAFNEAEHIYENILRVCEALKTISFEIVVVDDGSVDNTFLEAQRAQVDGCPVTPVQQDVNQGKGAALFRGFEFTSAKRIAFLDADLEIAPEYLLKLNSAMDESGANVLVGVKDMSENQFPWLRRSMSKLYKKSISFLFGLSITDTQTGIKLFKREVLEATVPRLKISRFAFDIELLLAASRFGYRIAEYPVKLTYSRRGNLGRMNTGNISGAFFDTLRIYSRASFWTWLEPSLSMRIWMSLFIAGVFLFGVGFGKLLTPVVLHGAVKSIFRILALQFLPTSLRDWLLLIVGGVLLTLAAIQLNKKLLEAFLRRDLGDDLAGIFRKPMNKE